MQLVSSQEERIHFLIGWLIFSAVVTGFTVEFVELHSGFAALRGLSCNEVGFFSLLNRKEQYVLH